MCAPLKIQAKRARWVVRKSGIVNMKIQRHLLKNTPLPLFLLLALISFDACAAINNAGILNNAVLKYSNAVSSWSATITTHATWLFWTLALISMVWTFGMLALRKADIGEFFAEFIRFTVTTGFFWWLLLNGPTFAMSIIDSLRTVGTQAGMAGGGVAANATPSGIVDIGFGVFAKVLTQSSVWSPIDSLVGLIISAIILVVFALIAVNMFLLTITAWILAYAGVFILGFGGGRWTSDMAIGYFKTVLSIGLQILTMVLLIGVGKTLIDDYYTNMSSDISLEELAVVLVVAVSLLVLVNKVPPLIGQLPFGGGTGGQIGSFGAGAAMGAAAMGAAAVATAGAALAAGGASMAGGAQAVMAAFSKANASESAGGGGSKDFMAAASSGGSDSGGGGSGGGSALAAAMGDSGGGSPGGGSSFASASGSSSGGNSSSSGDGADSGSSQSGGASAGSDAKGAGKGGGAPGEQKSGGALAAAGAAAAKVGRVAAGTAANLAQGSWDVAKAKASEMKDAALDRIGETTGGKIAVAIKASGAALESGSNTPSTFDDNSLSAGTSKSADAESEIAAFRDRDSKTT